MILERGASGLTVGVEFTQEARKLVRKGRKKARERIQTKQTFFKNDILDKHTKWPLNWFAAVTVKYRQNYRNLILKPSQTFFFFTRRIIADDVKQRQNLWAFLKLHTSNCQQAVKGSTGRRDVLLQAGSLPAGEGWHVGCHFSSPLGA